MSAAARSLLNVQTKADLSHGLLISGPLKQSIDDLNHFVVDDAVARDGFEQRNGNDLVGAQGGHASEFAAVDHVDSAKAVARGQDAVEGAGRSAALDVSKNHGASFEAGALFNFASEDIGNAAEFDVAKLVLAHVLQHGRALARFGGGELCAFGDHDDRKIKAALVALADGVCNFSTSKGRSGIRMTSAPPAMPLYRAIQPASRPITSTTMTRRWLDCSVQRHRRRR